MCEDADEDNSALTSRLFFLFRRLASLSLDLSLIGITGFLLWIEHAALILPWAWSYYAACSAWLGQRTAGMRVAGLFLSETRPSPHVFATWRSPLCRTVLWGLPVTLLTGGLGYIPFLMLRHDGRTLHEKLAHTAFSSSNLPEETFED